MISFKRIVVIITAMLTITVLAQEHSLREEIVGHWQMPREYFPSESCCPHITTLDIIISPTTSVMTFRGSVIEILSLSQYDETLYCETEEGWSRYEITSDTLTYLNYVYSAGDTTVFQFQRTPQEFAIRDIPNYETDIIGSWSSTDMVSEIRTLSFLKDGIIQVHRSDLGETEFPFLLRGTTLFFNATEYSVSLLGDTLAFQQRDSITEVRYVKVN